jgi:hypothetical protein
LAPFLTCCDDTIATVDLWVRAPGLTEAELLVGDTVSLVAWASAEGQGGASCNLYDASTAPEKFTFSSSDPDVVAIDERGFLSALSEGVANVSALAEGVDSNDVVVTVIDQSAAVTSASTPSATARPHPSEAGFVAGSLAKPLGEGLQTILPPPGRVAEYYKPAGPLHTCRP